MVEVEWDANEGTAIMVKRTNNTIKADSAVIKVNNSEVQLDTVARLIQNRVHVPYEIYVR